MFQNSRVRLLRLLQESFRSMHLPNLEAVFLHRKPQSLILKANETNICTLLYIHIHTRKLKSCTYALTPYNNKFGLMSGLLLAAAAQPAVSESWNRSFRHHVRYSENTIKEVIE